MRKKKNKAFVITKVKEKLIFVPPKKFLGKKISGAILLVLGSMIVTACLFNFYILPVLFSKASCPRVVPPEVKPSFPKRILIDRLNLDFPVEEAKIVGNQWGLSKTGLSYLPENSKLEDKGNLVIFGKNDPKFLGRLSEVKKSDKIYLFGEEKYLVFEVEETTAISPSDNSIFTASPERTLTIFSTSDYLKGRRFVVKARVAR
jgi:hypothetical protein